MVKKSIPVTITKSTDPKYAARFVMSASTPDRVKDTIDPAAYKSNLGKRILALWQHDTDQPFGVWENLKVEGGKLIGDLKTSGTELGKMIAQLIADDIPLGASIGFRGKGEPNKIGGIHFKELDIAECSVVSVPCHPSAYAVAKQFNLDLRSLGIEEDVTATSGQKKPLDGSAVMSRAKAALIAANRANRKSRSR